MNTSAAAHIFLIKQEPALRIVKKLTVNKMAYAIMCFITGTNVFAIGNHFQKAKDLCQSKYNLQIP